MNPGAHGDLMSPLALFLQADLVVKSVMIGLIIASVWTWAVIVNHWIRMRRLSTANRAYEQGFWGMERIAENTRTEDLPTARIAAAGLDEWDRSADFGPSERDGVRERLATALNLAVATEVNGLATRLNLLATVGSVSPFVGLFGTVWGIMRSFSDIAGQQSTSLAVVAPGIAEALFATALGLFAAIPAVIAYNRFSHGINEAEASYQRFADMLHTTLSRDLARKF